MSGIVDTDEDGNVVYTDISKLKQEKRLEQLRDNRQYSITIDLDKNELNDLLYGEIEIDKEYLSIEEDKSIKINVKLKYKEIEDWGDNSLDNPNKDV